MSATNSIHFHFVTLMLWEQEDGPMLGNCSGTMTPLDSSTSILFDDPNNDDSRKKRYGPSFMDRVQLTQDCKAT